MTRINTFPQFLYDNDVIIPILNARMEDYVEEN